MNAKRILLAGIAGTALMTMLMLVAPLMGGGVFSSGDMLMIAGSLMGHLVYGGTLGAISGAPAITQPVQGLGLRSSAAR